MKMLSIIRSINNYILKPYYDENFFYSNNEKWKILFVTIVYKLFFLFCFVIPITFLIEKFLFPIEIDSVVDKSSVFKTFFLSVIVAPILEELIFRLPLKFDYNPLSFIDTNKKILRKLWVKYFRFIFYISSIGFAVIHLFKFNNSQILFYFLAPLFITSQLIGGLILGYVRMFLGFKWAILNHSIFNLILTIGLGLTLHNVIVLEKSNNIFNLKVSELEFYNNRELKEIVFNEKTITSIHWNDETIQKLLDTLYEKRYKTFDNQLIKLDLTTTQPLPKEEFLTILREKYRIVEKDSLKK